MSADRTSSELTALTLRAAADLVRTKRVSPVELTRACLARIEQLNTRINAFITVTDDLALQQARAAESEIVRGEYRGPLHGIPIALKDLIDVAGVATTAASNVFRGRVATGDAEVVRRLKRAGALLIGKTNLHEFAYGGSSVVSAYGAVRNPINPEYTTGGSSGGSAAAVAAGMCYAAIGTDTAGSIRLPASYCGIVGLKPTYGTISVEGVVPLAWSFDHVGPMARTVEDAALLLDAISEKQYPVATNDQAKVYNSKLSLGIAREYFFSNLDSEVKARITTAVAKLQAIMRETRDVVVPIDADRTIHNAEAWTYHSEFVERTPELYQPETLRRIRRGADVSAADYIRAQQHLTQLRRDAARIFDTVDVIATPTVPIPPPTIAELESDIDQLRAKELVMLRNTRPFNVLGLPAISIPCGKTSAGLAVGLQLAAAPGAEAMLLAIAKAFEAAP